MEKKCSWKKLAWAMLYLVFLGGIMGPALVFTGDSLIKAHPLLLKMAAEGPENWKAVHWKFVNWNE